MARKVLVIVVAAMVLAVSAGPSPAASRSAGTRQAAQASLALPADLLASEIQVSVCQLLPCPERYKPAIAYNRNHNDYLVVWHNTWPDGSREIEARLVNQNGTVTTIPFTIANAVVGRFQPAVAYSETSDENLVVWMTDVKGDGSKYDIWGKIVPRSAPNTTVVFQIYTWANRSFWTPKVVWNSFRNEYFVIWNAVNTTTGLASDVAGVRVSAGGATVEPLAHIITADLNPHQASIAYNPARDEYLVVWRRMWTPGDGDIWGARVNWDGTLVGPAFWINQETVDQQSPSVATNGSDRYLVVWQQQCTSSTTWNIIEQLLDAFGAKLGSPSACNPAALPGKSPNVTNGGVGNNDFLTVWEQTTSLGTAIWAHRDRLAGNTLTSVNQFEVSPGNFWENKSPVVAADRVGYLVAYEGDSTADPTVRRHIFGRVWLPIGPVYAPHAVK